jgi:hypothetical protein
MQVESGTSDSYPIYRTKRLAKILAVCAGIVVLSISIGLISALEFTSYAVSHQKDPAMAGTFSFALATILIIGGIVGFMIAVWRVEYRAGRKTR